MQTRNLTDDIFRGRVRVKQPVLGLWVGKQQVQLVFASEMNKAAKTSIVPISYYRINKPIRYKKCYELSRIKLI